MKDQNSSGEWVKGKLGKIDFRNLLLSVIILFIMLMIISRYLEDRDQKREQMLQLTALKVGKADAIVIHTKDYTLLIDAGYASDGEKILKYFEEKGIKRLDYLILTHFDRDHIGGAARIISSIDVGRVYVPAYIPKNKEYKKLQKELEKKGITPMILNQPIQFTLNFADFVLHPAKESSYKQVNDYSMFLTVTHGKNRFLLTGDAENRRLKEWMEIDNSSYMLLKVPHHGNAEKATLQFLKVVNPDFAIITCSKERQPDREVVLALENQGCQVYFTKDGAITAVSDGKVLLVEQQDGKTRAKY